MTPTIDIVYTWVDGGRSDYQHLLASHASSVSDQNPERYRDHYSLLRYSLRSLEAYVPWAGQVFIVTARPQVPPWLDVSRGGVRVVHHDEIFDDPQQLPTFNSNAIESHLHRVPTSSDYFLYLNDDFLFGRPTPLGDFLTPDGRVRVHGTLVGEHVRARVRDGAWLSLGLVEHAPFLVHRPYWEDMLERFRDDVQRTREHRFRQPDDVRMDRLYSYHLCTARGVRRQVVPFFQLLGYHRFHKITNDARTMRKRLDALRRLRPRFYCLNDDQRDKPDSEVTNLVRQFLDEWYPEPSRFEKEVAPCQSAT